MSSKVRIIAESKTFDVDRPTIEVSTYIRNLLKNLNPDDDEDDDEDVEVENYIPEIPIQTINDQTMEKVIQWCEHYTEVNKDEIKKSTDSVDDDENGLRRSNVDNDEDDDTKPSVLDPWDKHFLDIDAELLQSVIKAANFLDIKPLLNASCKAVAELVRGRTPEEIINAFNAVQRGSY